MELKEILKYATVGLSYMISNENEINEKTKAELGRENNISLYRIDIYTKKFDALHDVIGKIANGTIENNTIVCERK